MPDTPLSPGQRSFHALLEEDLRFGLPSEAWSHIPRIVELVLMLTRPLQDKVTELNQEVTKYQARYETDMHYQEKLEGKVKLAEDLLNRSLAKLRIYYKQTKGEYAGGEESSRLRKDIEEAIALLRS